jgi:hypothetical protein
VKSIFKGELFCLLSEILAKFVSDEEKEREIIVNKFLIGNKMEIFPVNFVI